MAELRTEEEQLEAIKRWWKENGTSLIAGVAIAAAGVFGWNTWQDYQANKAEAASMRYQQLLDLTGQDNSNEQARQRATELVGEITDEHGQTLYADLARLLNARLAVEAGDRSRARSALEAVIEDSERESDLSYGIGVDLYGTEHVALTAEYIRHFDKDDFRIDAVNLGLTYQY